MAKRITQKMLEKLEQEKLGKHYVKVADLTDFRAYLKYELFWKPGLNISIWYPYHKGGWVISTTELDPDGYITPGTAKDWHVSDDEIIEVEILPYYTQK